MLICIIPGQLWAGESADEKIYEIIGNEIHSSVHEDQMVEGGLSGEVRFGLGGAILSRDTFEFGEYTGREFLYENFESIAKWFRWI